MRDSDRWVPHERRVEAPRPPVAPPEIGLWVIAALIAAFVLGGLVGLGATLWVWME